jgi:hypothetical protein
MKEAFLARALKKLETSPISTIENVYTARAGCQKSMNTSYLPKTIADCGVIDDQN